ncbi:MAG: hydroxymethylbilane synthase [Candidatus Eisenbacteria bacterium]|nr:hydroxymethylbilane synthase [Candidatus Eisenbacteria bacterium]
MILRLATRPRPAARARGRILAGAIRTLDPDLEIQLVDLPAHPDESFERLPEHDTGPTAEMRAALLRGDVEILVHAARDLPDDTPAGVRLAAIPRREDPRECLVSHGGLEFRELESGARIAVDSPARAWTVRAHRADLEVVRVEGPLMDRLARVERGELDGVIVAYAPMLRMGLRGRVGEILKLDAGLPAAGQAAAAVEIHAGEQDLQRLLNGIDDSAARWCVLAEREFQRAARAAGSPDAAAYGVVRDMEVRLRGRMEVEGRVVEGTEARPAQRLEGMGAALAGRLAG